VEILEIQDFLVSKWQEDWSLQVELDEEGQHSAELYKIWNEKSNFILRATLLNPFASTAFFWVDIGIFRNSSDMARFESWPLQRKVEMLPRDKIVLLLVEAFTAEELEMPPDDESLGVDFYYMNRLGGGIIGGYAAAIKAWHTQYYAMLTRYIHAQRFAGKDQSIMASVCLQNTRLCNLVQPPLHWRLLSKTQTQENPWFYLQDYLLAT